MPAAKSTTKADRKAYNAAWKKTDTGRAHVKENSIRYRNSPLGRMKIKEASDRRSEKRRQIAAAKTGKIAAALPDYFDTGSIQNTLTFWGGV